MSSLGLGNPSQTLPRTPIYQVREKPLPELLESLHSPPYKLSELPLPAELTYQGEVAFEDIAEVLLGSAKIFS
jgi:hypothetical protein